jgi:ParB-like chromosome segregation protein Spo0J
MTTSLAENPIIVDSAGVVIAGHCRLVAARLLGLPDVRVVVVPAPQATLGPQQ